MRLFVLTALLISIGFMPAWAADLAKGQEINGTCAACHGRNGLGGKNGEYPRLGGQRAAYIEDQLRLFQSRKRLNIPMLPYTQERELSEKDMKDVAAYLSSLVVPTRFPDFKDTDDALTRLEAMSKVMIVPKLQGNLENGSQLYREECGYCHGKNGMGNGHFPMLVGQYTNYLNKQIAAFLKGERPHDASDDDEDEETGGKAATRTTDKNRGILNRLTETDINDILAYITNLQDSPP